MTKKQFKKILNLHKDGISTIICIQSILELTPNKYEAAKEVDEFYHLVEDYNIVQVTEEN